MRKNFGSFGSDRNSCGCPASAACSAEVPHLGAPSSRKSGSRPATGQVTATDRRATGPHRRQHQLGAQLVRPVGPGALVVEPVAAVGQADHAQVAQPAPGVRRLGHRPVPLRGEHAGRARRVGQAGPLLPVLARGRPPVVGGRPLPVDGEHRAHPHPARVPAPGPRPQRGALVRSTAGRPSWCSTRWSSGPRGPAGPAGAPRPTGANPAASRTTTGSFTACSRSPGQHRPPHGVGELLGTVGLEHVDPPVLAARGGAADVEPPPALPGCAPARALQRLGAEAGPWSPRRRSRTAPRHATGRPPWPARDPARAGRGPGRPGSTPRRRAPRWARPPSCRPRSPAARPPPRHRSSAAPAATDRAWAPRRAHRFSSGSARGAPAKPRAVR